MTQTKYDKAVSVCFSGHRNIPFLYRKQLKLQLKAAITKAYAGGYRHFYCGCAMGFDMLAAEVALALQSELSGLQVIAVVPYRGQSERWNDAMKARYDTILCNSDDGKPKGGTFYTYRKATANGLKVLNLYGSSIV